MTAPLPPGARRTVGVAAALALGAASVAAAQTPIPPSAMDFALSAAQSDQYEILAARDAVAQTKNPQVRAFAQEMIEAHTRSSQDLKKAALASGMTPPPEAMSSDQAQLLSALQGLRGPEFDKAYAKQQVLAHTQALAVEQSYAAAGKDAHLTEMAKAAVPIIQHHLQMAQQLSGALGSS